MLTRLQTAKTPKAIRGFIYFTSLFIDKEGAPKVQQSLDAVQPTLFTILLEQIWLPNLQAMHFRHTDQKVVAVAMTKVSQLQTVYLACTAVWLSMSHFWLHALTSCISCTVLSIADLTSSDCTCCRLW